MGVDHLYVGVHAAGETNGPKTGTRNVLKTFMDPRRLRRDNYARVGEDEEAGIARPGSTLAWRGPANTSTRLTPFRLARAAIQVVAVGAVLVLFTTGMLYGAQRYWLEPRTETSLGHASSAADAQLRAALDVNATVVAEARQAVLFTPSA